MLTRERVNVSLAPQLAKAARLKSEESGVSISYVIQRALARWVATGEIAPVVESEKTWQAAGELPAKGAKRKK